MTKEEIIEAISEDKMMPFIQPEQLSFIVDFVIRNYAPSLPSNLDEAANRQAALERPYKWEEEQDGSFGVTPLFVMSNIRSAFKAAVKWMAGQGETYETEIVSRIMGNGRLLPAATFLVNPEYKEGDKVVVQIRKK